MDDYLKEKPSNFEINLKKRKENKIQYDLQVPDLEENNKNIIKIQISKKQNRCMITIKKKKFQCKKKIIL